MLYSKTIPAFSIGWKDWNGRIIFQEIRSLLGDISFIPPQYKNLASAFQRSIEWYKTVMPYLIVESFYNSLRSCTVHLQAADDMFNTGNPNYHEIRQAI